MKTDIVCLGDSIVYGYGASSGGGWPERAARRLGKRIVNSGENGDTTAQMLGRFKWDVIRHQPEEVVIMGGSNDILMGVPMDRIKETMTLLARSAFDARIRPIVAIPIPVDGKMLKRCWYSSQPVETVEAALGAYHEWLLAFTGEHGVAAVDFYQEYPRRMAKVTAGSWYMDGLHPTREGYRILADIFCDAYLKRADK